MSPTAPTADDGPRVARKPTIYRARRPLEEHVKHAAHGERLVDASARVHETSLYSLAAHGDQIGQCGHLLRAVVTGEHQLAFQLLELVQQGVQSGVSGRSLEHLLAKAIPDRKLSHQPVREGSRISGCPTLRAFRSRTSADQTFRKQLPSACSHGHHVVLLVGERGKVTESNSTSTMGPHHVGVVSITAATATATATAAAAAVPVPTEERPALGTDPGRQSCTGLVVEHTYTCPLEPTHEHPFEHLETRSSSGHALPRPGLLPAAASL
mmetsp:Transcript_12228/g.37015  ORF Transcript_12228/g.37015 Transcript_12228/m.37015 type:complete len:268 (+) Transcript_12228:119-922(+)